MKWRNTRDELPEEGRTVLDSTDNPMDSNEVCVGFIRNDVSFGLKTLKEFAYTERAEIVIDCMQKLFESLSDLDFDTSDDNYNEGYCNDEDFSDGWRIYGFCE